MKKKIPDQSCKLFAMKAAKVVIRNERSRKLSWNSFESSNKVFPKAAQEKKGLSMHFYQTCSSMQDNLISLSVQDILISLS